MGRLNTDPARVSKALPFDVATRLFDAAQEPAVSRGQAIADVVSYAKRQYPRFFYSKQQVAERSRLYSLELERRRSVDGERADG